MTTPWASVGVDLPEPVIPLEESFEGFLRLEWLELTDELAHVRLQVRDDLKQPLGLVHGGVYSAVAETIASVATARRVWKGGRTAAGMANVANFLRPVTSGQLEAICRRRGHDADRWVWTTDFIDEQGRLCALVEVTIAVRPTPAAARE